MSIYQPSTSHSAITNTFATYTFTKTQPPIYTMYWHNRVGLFSLRNHQRSKGVHKFLQASKIKAPRYSSITIINQEI